jgi:hypothetical protein
MNKIKSFMSLFAEALTFLTAFQKRNMKAQLSLEQRIKFLWRKATV